MPCPLLIVSQSDSLIQVVDTNSHTESQTVQIQISWLPQKPTDLYLHCLQRQGISVFSRTRVKRRIGSYNLNSDLKNECIQGRCIIKHLLYSTIFASELWYTFDYKIFFELTCYCSKGNKIILMISMLGKKFSTGQIETFFLFFTAN